MTETELLTCEETAERLRVSVETVRNLANAGELPGSKIGRAWRFPKAEIDALLRCQSKSSAPASKSQPVATTKTREFSNLLPDTDSAVSGGIDPEALLSRCLGNIDFAQSMLQEMEETTARHLDSIRECAAREDCEGIAQAAHSLKGAAGIICATQLGQEAAKLEEASRNCQAASELRGVIGSVFSAAETCLASIPFVLQQHSRPSVGI
jgi:excisionase family DNA binding protein